MIKKFKIRGIEESNNTMVVDWLDGQVYNHEIPELLLLGHDFTDEQTWSIIEQMRPVPINNNYVIPSVMWKNLEIEG